MSHTINNIFAEFEKIVNSRPYDTMIITKDNRYSYQQIYNESIWYAQQLRKLLAGKKGRVLLEFKHSYKIIVAILAVLHEGCSYVPLRESDMRNLDKISEITNSNVIMSDRVIDKCSLNQIMISNIHIDKSNLSKETIEPASSYDRNEEVYVLFTSGSTGTPKGCSISMSNLNYIINNMKMFNSPGKMVYGFTTPYTFDVSTTEIYSFLYGAILGIIDITEYTEFRQFPELICRLGITHLSMSPSGFSNILKSFSQERIAKMSNCLKYAFIAGEVFSKNIWNIWEENNWPFRLYNMYGPTEATVYATMYELEHGKKYDTSIPIGVCLDGAHYIIDGENTRSGELVICGDGISNGYINNDEEGKRRFYHKDGKRYYRTGDYVSVQDDGLIYYHGRKDDQVQINGIRVELGEISARIRQLEYMEESMVLQINNQLVAFVQYKENDEHTTEFVRNDFTKVMPRYMLPNTIITVKKFELTSHGKIDRKKLVHLYEKETSKSDVSMDKASNDAATILNIMNDCLGEIRMHSIADDFYEAGADSLVTFAVAGQIADVLGYSIYPDDIYSLRSPINITHHFSKSAIICDTNTHDNDGGILKKITKLNRDISDYLYTGDFSGHEFAAIHYQYYYFPGRFNVMISFEYRLKNTNVEEAAVAICRVVRKNRILGSSIKERNGYLYFKEHTPPRESDIPVFPCNLENVSDYIREYCEKEVYNARYMSGRLALFVIIRRSSDINIIGVLDHCIADGACVSIIKKKLSDELNHIDSSSCLQYEDYCCILRENNSDIGKALDCKYIQELKECKVKARMEQISSIPDKEMVFTVNNPYVANNMYTVFYIMYKVGKSFETILTHDEYALRTIINLREYKKYSFKDTIGDMHTNIAFRYSKGISYEDFVKRCEDTIDYFSENLFSPSFMKHKKMLPKSENQEKLESILTDCKLFSIDYLGEISENDIETKSRDIRELQIEMYRDEKLIYITAVTCADKIIIYTNKEITMEHGEP